MCLSNIEEPRHANRALAIPVYDREREISASPVQREQILDERQHVGLGANRAVNHKAPDALICASLSQLASVGFRERFESHDFSDKGPGFQVHDDLMIKERRRVSKLCRGFGTLLAATFGRNNRILYEKVIRQ
jgi:hypothetical protein